jgi:hypothetical protein
MSDTRSFRVARLLFLPPFLPSRTSRCRGAWRCAGRAGAQCGARGGVVRGTTRSGTGPQGSARTRGRPARGGLPRPASRVGRTDSASVTTATSIQPRLGWRWKGSVAALQTAARPSKGAEHVETTLLTPGRFRQASGHGWGDCGTCCARRKTGPGASRPRVRPSSRRGCGPGRVFRRQAPPRLRGQCGPAACAGETPARLGVRPRLGRWAIARLRYQPPRCQTPPPPPPPRRRPAAAPHARAPLPAGGVEFRAREARVRGPGGADYRASGAAKA